MPLLPGSRVGRYEISELIGAGGQGEVYRANDMYLRRQVAVKLLRVDYKSDPQFRARLRREASILAELNHPNICTIYDVVHKGGQLALIMEFLDGQTLADRLKVGPFTEAEVIGVGLQLASALAATHAHGILHRDIKPGNVFVSLSGHIKILDFGLAKDWAGATPPRPTHSLSSAAFTGVGAMVGTPGYMTPEQARGEPLDPRVDIYSVGVVLYELCTGKLPFQHPLIAYGSTVVQPIPLRERKPDINAHLAEVIDRSI